MRSDDEGHLTITLNSKKFTHAIIDTRKLGSTQTKIEKNKLFLFPDLQETVNATVLLEFMKIRISSCMEERNIKLIPFENKNLTSPEAIT